MERVASELLKILRRTQNPNCTIYLIWHYVAHGNCECAKSEFARDSDKLGFHRQEVSALLESLPEAKYLAVRDSPDSPAFVLEDCIDDDAAGLAYARRTADEANQVAASRGIDTHWGVYRVMSDGTCVAVDGAN